MGKIDILQIIPLFEIKFYYSELFIYLQEILSQ